MTKLVWNKGDVLVLKSKYNDASIIRLETEVDFSDSNLHAPYSGGVLSVVTFRILAFDFAGSANILDVRYKYPHIAEIVDKRRDIMRENGLKVPEESLMWLATLEAFPLIGASTIQYLLNHYNNVGPCSNIETVLKLYT